MSNKHLITAGWIAVSATTFALGWALKPAPEPAASEQGSSKRPTAVPPERLSALQLPDYRSSLESVELATEFGITGSWIGSGRALNAGEIQELGLRFSKELDPLKRRSAFLQLIDGLTVENAKIIREQIADRNRVR